MILVDIVAKAIEPVPFASGAIASAVIAHLWRRYQGRMIVLSVKVEHQHIALSGEDNRFGKIEVLHNDNPVKNVYFTTISLSNESSKDLDGVVLNTLHTDGSKIRVSTGAVDGSANVLNFAPGYQSILDEFLKKPSTDPDFDQHLDFLTTRRDYLVPVLNRGGKVIVNLLVEAPDGASPYVQVSTDHKGVEIKPIKLTNVFWRVNRDWAALIGLAVGGAGAIGIASASLSATQIALLSFTFGALVAAIGAVCIRGVGIFAKLLN